MKDDGYRVYPHIQAKAAIESNRERHAARLTARASAFIREHRVSSSPPEAQEEVSATGRGQPTSSPLCHMPTHVCRELLFRVR